MLKSCTPLSEIDIISFIIFLYVAIALKFEFKEPVSVASWKLILYPASMSVLFEGSALSSEKRVKRLDGFWTMPRQMRSCGCIVLKVARIVVYLFGFHLAP